MSRSFLTGINLNKNELLNARIQNLATAPSSPVAGQIYYNTDDNTLRYYNGTAWLTLAQGGDLSGAISAAIDALTTDDIEEGSTNLYYTDTRAKDDAAALLTGATLENITITGDGDGLTITAENGVADSDTDDLTEGTTNLYFTDQRALDATASAYDPAGSAASAQSAAESYADGLAVNYDPAGSASTAETNANSYTDTEIDALDTNAIEEGLNLYFTDERAQDAVGNAVGTGLTYTDITGAIAVDTDTIATRTYVDNAVSGLSWKEAVHLYATTNVALTGAHGTLEIDGHEALVLEDKGLYRILLSGQSTATQNGIYVYNDAGSGNYQLDRAADSDTVAELIGAAVFVMEGTTYGGTSWVQNNHYADTFDDLTWTQFSGAGTITAGDGIAVDGLEVSVDLASPSGLSTATGGLAVVAGDGLVIETLSNSLKVNVGTGLAIDSTGVTFASGYGIKKYTTLNTELTPSSGVVTWTVTHSLGTAEVIVQVYDKNTLALVEVDVVRTSSTVVTLSWAASATVSANAYTVTVIG